MTNAINTTDTSSHSGYSVRYPVLAFAVGFLIAQFLYPLSANTVHDQKRPVASTQVEMQKTLSMRDQGIRPGHTAYKAKPSAASVTTDYASLR